MDAFATPRLMGLATQMNRSAIRAMRDGSYQEALGYLQSTASLISNIALIQQLIAMQEVLAAAAGQQQNPTRADIGNRDRTAETGARAGAQADVQQQPQGQEARPGHDQAGQPDQNSQQRTPWIVPVHVPAAIEENEFCIFQHAFELVAWPTQGGYYQNYRQNSTPAARLQFLYSVTLYNQGLVIHLWATVREPMSLLLLVALRYYETALECLAQATAETEQNHQGAGNARARTPEEILLELSLRNNMGYIYCHQQRNLAAASECLEHLSSSVSTLHNIFQPAFNEAFGFFLVSVGSFGCSPFSLAPAA